MRKVYLIAYACEPLQGGEHEVGWMTSNFLHGKCELIVITRESNKNLIEKHNSKAIKFIYIENDFFLKYKRPKTFSYLYYFFWQYSVYKYLKDRVEENDMVHYITFGNIHLPHFLFLLRSKLVIGPMGGVSVVNPKLIRNPGFLLKLKYILHNFLNWSIKFNPIQHLVFFKSSKIILRTEEMLGIIPKCYHKKCIVFLETGIDSKSIFEKIKKRELNKIVTTSRIIKSKNLDQVIEVFIKLFNKIRQPLTLYIAGDGPLKHELNNKYQHYKNIIFLGKIPHEQINDLLKDSDLFLFCSIKEGGSHSLFEAAMNNIPIACYDISGMKVFPNKYSAIKITPTENIDENIEKLSEKIIEAFQNNQIDILCKNAIEDLRENYDWEKISEKYLKIYNEISEVKV